MLHCGIIVARHPLIFPKHYFLGRPERMPNPVSAMLKAARMVNKGRPLSAALVMQRALAPAKISGRKPKLKAKATKAKSSLPKPDASARPLPGTFVDGVFTNKNGTLNYKLYTPIGSPRRRLPLVVMLHGCTQSASDFATGTGMNALADEMGFAVLYPEQSSSANMARCWNWHRPGNQSRGKGEPALIAALTQYAIAKCRANPARVYIAGISAGGAAAAIVAQAYPELFVAVGIHSGVAHGSISTLREAIAAMRGRHATTSKTPTSRPRPTIIFHGDRDEVVHPSNPAIFLSDLQRSVQGPLTSRAQYGQSAGGRDFTRTQYRNASGEVMLDNWTIHGSGHSWSGGARAGSHTDPAGPDASREMLRFFLARKKAPARRHARSAA